MPHPPTSIATLKDWLKFLGIVTVVISLGLWIQSDQFKMILGVGLSAVPVILALALFVVLAWASIKKNETAIFVLAAASCGVLVSIYHESNDFRDVSWHEWLFIIWCLMALKDEAQLIIANGVAAGIAKAKAAQIEKPLSSAEINSGFKEYLDAKAAPKS